MRIIIPVIILLLTGCKSTEYVPVERVRDVYHNTTDTVRDSIRHDVYVKEWMKGDTVYRDSIDVRYVDRWRVKHDTVIEVDSIPVITPVKEEPSLMQEIQTGTWWWLLVACVGLTLMVIGNNKKK